MIDVQDGSDSPQSLLGVVLGGLIPMGTAASF